MTYPKEFWFKIFGVITILVVSQLIYSRYFFEKDLQEHSPIINLSRDVGHSSFEIIYLAESSNVTTGPEDLDKRSISEYISEYFPSIKFGHLTQAAIHAGIYYEMLRNIPENSKVKTVIVTLNLRSFDANWIYSDLETALQKSMVLIKDNPPLINRFLLSFKGYDVKTEREREQQFKEKWKKDLLSFPYEFKYKNVIQWDKAMAMKGIRNQDGSINYPMTELACHYIKTYAFQIDTITNPRIHDFDKIVQLAKKRNWNLLFNLMAENIDQANALVGKELPFLLQQNRDLLVSRYTQMGVILVDNLSLLSDKDFLDRNWTTEHYNENGRRMIARKVATELKKIYPEAFEEVKAPLVSQSQFFHNCEDLLGWGQEITLTTEKAFSGNRSSLIFQTQPYSITLDQSVSVLGSQISKVDISFNMFQEVLLPEAKLVIEIAATKTPSSWNGFKLAELNSVVQNWVAVNYQFILPENFKMTDRIKVYILNEDKRKLFVDDLRIRFN